MSNQEEVQAIKEVLSAFYHYEEHARREIITPKQLKYDSLTPTEQSLIPWFPDHLKSLEHCIRQNGDFCRRMSTAVAPEWGIVDPPTEWGPSKYHHYDKVKSIFKQLVREWSSEGKSERDVAFNRFFKELEDEYPDFESRQNVKLLVPGAGLGRLNYEFVKRGFWCQASSESIFPFIHSTSNQLSRKWQTRPVFFPDEHPTTELSQVQSQHPTVPIPDLMSITSGSFIDLYGPPTGVISTSRHYSHDQSAREFRLFNQSQFQYIITNFFIDTSPNVIEYLETLHHALTPNNGKWINFGPLLWHFEDSSDVEDMIVHPDGVTIKRDVPVKGLELSLEDLIELANRWFGFTKRESGVESGYSSDSKAMGGWRYQCEFWVAVKKGAR